LCGGTKDWEAVQGYREVGLDVGVGDKVIWYPGLALGGLNLKSVV